ERNIWIEHRGYHIHEWHMGDHPVEEIRTHVHHRAHKQSTRASAHGVYPVRIGVLFGHEMFGGCNEIGECILLVHKFTAFVPTPALLLSTANMSDRVDEPPVQ